MIVYFLQKIAKCASDGRIIVAQNNTIAVSDKTTNASGKTIVAPNKTIAAASQIATAANLTAVAASKNYRRNISTEFKPIPTP